MADTLALSAPAPVLTVVDGIPTTTSTDVARHFGKRHDRVLEAIRNLLPQLPSGGLPNFREGYYTLPETGDQQHRQYLLTRDGFTLLAMGFTGKKALAFKLAYIDAFNRMEQALHTGALTPSEYGELLDKRGQIIVERERIKLAHSLAAEVAAAASRTVFDAVMAGGPDWQYARWLFSLDYDSRARQWRNPRAQAIEGNAMVASLSDLARHLLDGASVLATNKELADLAAACNQKLAQRLAQKALQPSATNHRKESHV